MVTVGVASDGVGEGGVVGVAGTLVGVFTGVGTMVGPAGATVGTGAAVGASVGGMMTVGTTICVAASPPQAATRTNATQISRLCKLRGI